MRENYKRPDWALGAITAHDALPLMRDRPMKCIEIGVAVGLG